MKLIVAIVQDKDSASLTKKLIEHNIRATKLASTGSFLKEGNTTFLIGINEEQMDLTLNCIKESCQTRKEIHIQAPILNGAGIFPTSIEIGGATVFVLEVSQFQQF